MWHILTENNYLQYSELVFKSVGGIQFSLVDERSDVFLQLGHVCVVLLKFSFQRLQQTSYTTSVRRIKLKSAMPLMRNSHRSPDTTRQCCLCRVTRCELSLEIVWQSLNS